MNLALEQISYSLRTFFELSTREYICDKFYEREIVLFPLSSVALNMPGIQVYFYSTVLMKVNVAHRARNAFKSKRPGENRASEKGLIQWPNISKASSIEYNERDHSKLSSASSTARLSSEISNFQFTVSSVRKFMEVRKCNVSVMFVFPLHLYRLIH